jgi:hypothetical protein
MPLNTSPPFRSKTERIEWNFIRQYNTSTSGHEVELISQAIDSVISAAELKGNLSTEDVTARRSKLCHDNSGIEHAEAKVHIDGKRSLGTVPR